MYVALCTYICVYVLFVCICVQRIACSCSSLNLYHNEIMKIPLLFFIFILLSIQENQFGVKSLHAIHVLYMFYSYIVQIIRYVLAHMGDMETSEQHTYTVKWREKIGNSKLGLHSTKVLSFQLTSSAHVLLFFYTFRRTIFSIPIQPLCLCLSISVYYSIIKLIFSRMRHKKCPLAKIYQTNIMCI